MWLHWAEYAAVCLLSRRAHEPIDHFKNVSFFDDYSEHLNIPCCDSKEKSHHYYIIVIVTPYFQIQKLYLFRGHL